MAAALASGRTALAPAAAAATAGSGATDRRPRVAVVGAGFAGLAAALTLQRSGCCDVVVLEASSRPGGRACTQRLPSGLSLELGATWLHGLGSEEEPNPVFRHAVEQGLIGENPEAEQWWSSQFLLPGATQPLSKEQQIAVTHTLAAWTRVVEGLPKDAQGTTAQHLQAAWEELVASGRVAPEQLEVARRAWRWRELLQRAMDGCDSTSQQSAQGLALYDEMPGGVHAAMPAGMQTVAERLAAQLQDLRYQHAVQRISWGNSSSGGSSSGPSRSGVSLACTNGNDIEADAAIVTVSLGVLKAQHKQLFQPPLPAAKVEAIEKLRIGTVDKLFLDFSPAGSNGSGGNAADAEPAAAGAVAPAAAPAVSYALLWDCPWQCTSAGQQQAAAAAGGSAAADQQLPDWVTAVFSMRFGGPEFKYPSDERQQGGSAQPVQAPPSDAEAAAAEEQEEFNPCAEAEQPTCYQAVSWLTGEAASGMEAASDEEVLRALRQLAVQYPQLQLPPGANWDAVRVHRSRWGSDPLFRGSYSYLGPDCTPADVAALAEPVYASAEGGAGSSSGGSSSDSSQLPALLFAGEACHVKYIGTMPGAYLTGQRQAELLLQHFQQHQQQHR